MSIDEAKGILNLNNQKDSWSQSEIDEVSTIIHSVFHNRVSIYIYNLNYFLTEN